MLRFSKHSEHFFSNLQKHNREVIYDYRFGFAFA
jgi:hypothetical protein